jgi:predicted nucleotidyltransferase component of viral defense system
MRDLLLQQMERVPLDQRYNQAREYLQVYLLQQIQEIGYGANLAFLGGTALRLLYDLPRFSEDLDFSWEPKKESKIFDSVEMFTGIKQGLEKSGYKMLVKTKTRRNVASAFFRFQGIPAAIGTTNDKRLSISIKVDVDSLPPAGANLETTLIQRFFPVALRHYDLPSMFAGKLHALLARSYTKGRDWFDLVWYLTEKKDLIPNLILLKNALIQTDNLELDYNNWPKLLRDKINQLDWKIVENDLRPFLVRQNDLLHIQPNLVVLLLERYEDKDANGH